MAGLREEFKRSCSQINIGLVKEASMGVEAHLRSPIRTTAAPRRTSRGTDLGALREEFKRSYSQLHLDLAKEASVEINDPTQSPTSTVAATRRTSRGPDLGALREEFKASFGQMHSDLAKEASVEVNAPIRSPIPTNVAERRTSGRTDLASLREGLKKSYSQMHMDLAKEASVEVNVPVPISSRTPTHAAPRRTSGGTDLSALREELKRSCSQMHMDLAKEISVGVQATPLRPDMAALREEFSRSCSKIYVGLEEEASLTVDVARTSKSMSVNEDPTANDRLHADVLQGTSGGAKDMEARREEFALFCSQIKKGFAKEASVTVDIARASQSKTLIQKVLLTFWKR